MSRVGSTPRTAVFDATPSIVPSYTAKLDRAEHHLDELKEAIKAFGGTGTEAASRSYTITRSSESRSTVHQLEFTRSVSKALYERLDAVAGTWARSVANQVADNSTDMQQTPSCARQRVSRGGARAAPAVASRWPLSHWRTVRRERQQRSDGSALAFG